MLLKSYMKELKSEGVSTRELSSAIEEIHDINVEGQDSKNIFSRSFPVLPGSQNVAWILELYFADYMQKRLKR